ncbi:MAG: phosphatidylserine/phosphatidylglycerophosphate/cardiolipin synthase family protein [Oligoflexia bacterium]|nr:phosphatidylserine/phosphatidylglycerophosphate/cardiolipin synthase family protein [Oligoflexia bacterium]
MISKKMTALMMVITTMLMIAIATVSPVNSSAGEDLLTYLRTPEAQDELDNITATRESVNRVKVLHRGAASLNVRMKLIENARRFVYITVPYWHPDAIGKRMYELLKYQKTISKPNLEVQLMMDWSSKISVGDTSGKKITNDLNALVDDPIVRWNHPDWVEVWSLKLFDNHLHEKIFLVDGKDAVVGGQNIGEHYQGVGPEGWHDTDILLTGPAVQDLLKYYVKKTELARWLKRVSNTMRWSMGAVPRACLLQDYFMDKDLSCKSYFSYINDYRAQTRYPFEQSAEDELQRLQNVQSELQQEEMQQKEMQQQKDGLFTEQFEYDSDLSGVRVVLDLPLSSWRPENTHWSRYSKVVNTVEFLLTHAQREARFFIPYMSISWQMENALIMAAKRGIRVEIITNSFNSLDSGKVTYKVAIGHYYRLLQAGVKIYEWQGNKPLTDIIDNDREQKQQYYLQVMSNFATLSLDEQEKILDDIAGIYSDVGFDRQLYRQLLNSGRINVHKLSSLSVKLAQKYQCSIPDEYWPGATTHTKVVVIDGVASMIGSDNLNVRSETYNSELMALIIDPIIGAKMREIFNYDIGVTEKEQKGDEELIQCGDRLIPRPPLTKEITLEGDSELFTRGKLLKARVLQNFQKAM